MGTFVSLASIFYAAATFATGIREEHVSYEAARAGNRGRSVGEPAARIGLQVFDGVAAALYGVLLTVITADLARGTGRFNFLQGAMQSAMGLGGFLSNLAFGFVAKTLGFNPAFAGLSVFAVAGGLLHQLRMPETRQR